MTQQGYLDLFTLKSNLKELEIKSDDFVTREEVAIDRFSLTIYSSNGWYFTNGNVDTQLMVVVKNGVEDITSTLPSEQFVWRRSSTDKTADEEWNATKRTGKFLQISSFDIVKGKNTTFICDLLDENGQILLSSL
jgi:hypothetical protein